MCHQAQQDRSIEERDTTEIIGNVEAFDTVNVPGFVFGPHVL